MKFQRIGKNYHLEIPGTCCLYFSHTPPGLNRFIHLLHYEIHAHRGTPTEAVMRDYLVEVSAKLQEVKPKD